MVTRCTYLRIIKNNEEERRYGIFKKREKIKRSKPLMIPLSVSFISCYNDTVLFVILSYNSVFIVSIFNKDIIHVILSSMCVDKIKWISRKNRSTKGILSKGFSFHSNFVLQVFIKDAVYCVCGKCKNHFHPCHTISTWNNSQSVGKL